LVADSVTMSVIVCLEIVYIEYDTGEGEAVDPGEFDSPCGRPAEVGAAAQARHVVHFCRSSQGRDLLQLRMAHEV